MQVRQVGPDDWETWRLLRQRSLSHDRQAFSASTQQWTGDRDTEQNWRDRLAAPGACFVAEHGRNPVGMVAIHPQDDGDQQLISMWVVPGVRGRGVGRALIGRVIAEAAGGPLHLRVMAANAEAVRLYQRCGFVLAGGEPDAEDCLLMRHRPRG